MKYVIKKGKQYAAFLGDEYGAEFAWTNSRELAEEFGTFLAAVEFLEGSAEATELRDGARIVPIRKKPRPKRPALDIFVAYGRDGYKILSIGEARVHCVDEAEYQAVRAALAPYFPGGR